MTRLNTSRPYWSLPNKNGVPGLYSACVESIWIGSVSGSMGAATAARIMIDRMARPATAPLLRSRRRRLALSTSGVTDARVQHRVQQVHHQVDDHVAHGDDQHHALHHWKVLVQDAVNDQPAQAGPREHGLHHDGA